MPEFDAVTGVSTGTPIAPFAFFGDEQSIDQIVELYRNPQVDWVKQRGKLYFLPDNISFAEVPGLEREIHKHITVDMVRRIAKVGADGRILDVKPACSKNPHVGDFQQSVPPGAGSDGAKLGGGYSTQPGHCHSRLNSDRRAAPLCDGRRSTTQTRGRRRGACRINPRHLVSAGSRNVYQRDNE